MVGVDHRFVEIMDVLLKNLQEKLFIVAKPFFGNLYSFKWFYRLCYPNRWSDFYLATWICVFYGLKQVNNNARIFAFNFSEQIRTANMKTQKNIVSWHKSHQYSWG